MTGKLNRRVFTFSALAAVPALAACTGGVGNANASKIDARVQATLNKMYHDYPDTRTLAAKASGMLVMPLITEGGFMVGGGYGQGALLVNGAIVDYYSSTKANFGLQIGVQQYAHVLFFMTPDALRDFRQSPGWVASADAVVVFSDKGNMLRADSTTLSSPVIAVVFGQAGLKLGATIEGMKYSRILP